MKHKTLTQMQAKALPAGKYADGQGLWLVKRDRAVGKWVLRLAVFGRRREMGLGPWPDVSIAEARAQASDARRVLREGADPILARAKQRASARRLTLAEAIDGCYKAKQAELKGDGKAGRWLSPLTVHVIPKLGTMPIEDIDQHSLLTVLEPIWHTKPEAARKAVNRINLTLKYAAALGLDVDLQAPMKAQALLGKQRHEIQHIPSLPYAEMPRFYQWLKTKSGVASLALQFLILTVARTSEVRLARFAEIEHDCWLLDASRTKTGKPHRIPLTPEAIALVAHIREQTTSEYLFPSVRGQPISDMAMSTFMKREGYEARPHGFRATFRTWVEEQTDTPYEVKEAALGHVVDSETVRAYQRSDRFEKRRELMGRWWEFLRK